MEQNLDKFAEEMQNKLWECFSQTVIDHARNPRNVGDIKDADGYGSAMGSCGDNMEVWIKVQDGIIKQATFWTDGCSTTIAAGSMATEMARSRSVTDAVCLSRDEVLDALGGLPEDSEHCAVLAANAIKEAVRDYLAGQREPWKKAYKKPSLSD